MPTRDLVLAAALLGAAFSSSALLSCKNDEVRAEPPAAASVASTPTAAPLDPNDPEALRRAAAVIATWNEKDPVLTAKVLKDNGVVITDPATFKAMADAQAAASAAVAAVPSGVPSAGPAAGVQRRPAPPQA